MQRLFRNALKVVVALAAAAVFIAACSSDKKAPSNPQGQGQAQTITAFGAQSTATPYPADKLTHSLERDNLAERLVRLNDPSKIGYVYLLSITGQPFGFYSIKGKVSNPDSQMTTNKITVPLPNHGDCGDPNNCVTVDAPGDDGSYGPNEQGIFFFTTEGTLVETSVAYIYSDAPLPIDVPKLNAK